MNHDKTNTPNTRHERPRRTLDASGLTDRGQVRTQNEDQFVLADLSRSLRVKTTTLDIDDASNVPAQVQAHLAVVADGMGGQPGGEAASRAAAGEASRYVLESVPCNNRNLGVEELHEEFESLIRSCEEAVRFAAQEDSARAAMGTTLTLAYLQDQQLHVAHVGDSRCYLLRNNRLEQVTKDHTLATRLVDQNVLREQDAQDSGYANVLWNALGGGAEPAQPDIFTVNLHDVDAVLLCSDGLSGPVDDATIARILTRSGRAEVACRALVDEANARGGRDNITAVVAYLTETKSVLRQQGLPADEAVRSITRRVSSGARLQPCVADVGLPTLGEGSPLLSQQPKHVAETI